MTAVKTQDLVRSKLATSEYTFTAARGDDKFTFGVTWNWNNGADRWLWVCHQNAVVNGEGRTLDLVKKGICEKLNEGVTAAPEKPKRVRPSRAKGKEGASAAPSTTEVKPKRVRTRKAKQADADAAHQAVLDAAARYIEERNSQKEEIAVA